ncbi:MAG: GtrA family protein [Pigmentiphaga sp.]|nr:GtrA family protein [Pigmentiphaga sp.]
MQRCSQSAAAVRHLPNSEALLTATRFCLSGGAATGLHYLFMLLAVDAGGSPGAATALGALVGAVANYRLQRRFTFSSPRTHRSASARYLAAAALGWLLNLSCFTALHAGLLMPALAAQIFTTLLVALCNYPVFKRYVF